MTVPTLLLASTSPRRRALLRAWGLEFDVVPVAVDEAHDDMAPVQSECMRLALAKANALAGVHSDALGRYVLAADTLVSFDGRHMSKPKDEGEALMMLERIAGNTVEVVTGVALVVVASGITACDFDRTFVRMRRFDRAEASAYVATREPMDKAGAFAIQGKGSKLVASIDGSWSNVVGLGKPAVFKLLAGAGYPGIDAAKGREHDSLAEHDSV